MTARKVQATAPDGTVTTRSSTSKHYTHAVAIYSPAAEGYEIPAGKYTIPAKRIRGRNIKAYEYNHSGSSVPAREESFGILSFHTSAAAAAKAGQTWVNQAARSAADTRATFGVDATPIGTSFRVVEVEEI